MLKKPGSFDDLYAMMPKYIQEYINFMSIRTQISTQYNYLLDYRNFLEWMISTKRTKAGELSLIDVKEINTLKFLDLQEYFSFLVGGYETHRNTKREYFKKASSKPNGSGLKRKRASLTSLFLYLYAQRGLLDQNEMSKFVNQFKDINKDSRLQIYLSEDEVKRLFEAVDDLDDLEEPYLSRAINNQIRNWAILVTLLETGMRVSTLCALNLRDIDFEKKDITMKLKGGKEKRLPVRDSVLNAMTSYLKDKKRPISQDTDADKAVFLSSWGNRISIQTIQYMVKKYIVKAGLNYDFSVHSLRHTFGTNFYNATGYINLTADFLCHADPSTASRFYAGIKDETRRAALEKLPRWDKEN